MSARGGFGACRQRSVAQNTQVELFGFIGEPRLNVLELNLALDALPH